VALAHRRAPDTTSTISTFCARHSRVTKAAGISHVGKCTATASLTMPWMPLGSWPNHRPRYYWVEPLHPLEHDPLHGFRGPTMTAGEHPSTEH